MRAVYSYAFNSNLRNFCQGYRLFFHVNGTHGETPTGPLKFVSKSPEVAK